MGFSSDFLWGAATSAYQIEGATREDGRGPSTWDQFAATPGRTHGGATGELAADHYHRMEQDVALMAELGLNAYRFSIAWPRILPEGRGQTNAAGIAFYDRLVDCLLEYGITPMVTLYHWDLPLALYEEGGWCNRDTALAFADYAEIVARHLGDRVAWWVTHNEPWCSAYLGYGEGLHAPGIRGDMQAVVDVGHHLLLSHGLAVQSIRAQAGSGARAGIALNLFPIFAAESSPQTVRTVERADRFHNRWFLDPIYRGDYTPGLFEDLGAEPRSIRAGDLETIGTPTDFLGVNYYNRWIVRAAAQGNGHTPGDIEYVPGRPEAAVTTMGWEVYPHGLNLTLEEITRRYRPPALVITENGASFDDQSNGGGRVSDTQRVLFLREHLQEVAHAREHGAPIVGYFAWSLLDNFEWADGYSKRFGLVYVDFATQRRIVKDSGRWYSGFIAAQRALHSR